MLSRSSICKQRKAGAAASCLSPDGNGSSLSLSLSLSLFSHSPIAARIGRHNLPSTKINRTTCPSTNAWNQKNTDKTKSLERKGRARILYYYMVCLDWWNRPGQGLPPRTSGIRIPNEYFRIYLNLHEINFHCFALHCFALHCIALLCFAFALLCCLYFALHCFALHCFASHCFALHALYRIAVHYINN